MKNETLLTLKKVAENYASEPVDQRDRWVVIERKLKDPCVEFESGEVQLIIQGLHSLEEWYYEKINGINDGGGLSQTDIFNRELLRLKRNKIQEALEDLESDLSVLENIGKRDEKLSITEADLK